MMMSILFGGCAKPDEDNVLRLYLPAGSSQWTTFANKLKTRFPDINFDIGYYTGTDQTDYMISRITHDDTGDLVFTTTKLTEAEQKEYLLDLSGYDLVNRYDTGLLENFTIEDKVYQLPYQLTLRCLAYNKTMFEEHGWKEPSSYDELIALIRQIRTEAPGVTPIAMSLGGLAYPFTLVTTLSQCEYLSTIDGARWEKNYLAGEGSVAEGWADGLQMTAGLIDAGAFDPEKYVNVWDGNVVKNDFATGGSAMMIMWAGQNELLNAMNDPDNPYEFGLMPFFGTTAGNMCVGVSLNCCWGLNKHLSEAGNEKKLENALKVMDWLASEEGYQAGEPTGATLSPFKDMGDSVAPQFRDLWHHTADGYRAIPIYAGFENIVIECGTIIQDAMLKGNSKGAAEKFVETADTMYKQSLQDQGSDVVGQCGEDIKDEAIVQLMADILYDTGLGDIALVTRGDVAENTSANRRGACGVLYKGDIHESDLLVLQSDSRNIQVLTLSGEQVNDLLDNGKTTPDNNYQDGLEATWNYNWAGNVDGLKDHKLDPSKTYRVVFLYGDYPVEWKDTMTIEDTGVTQPQAIRAYLETHDPLMRPKGY